MPINHRSASLGRKQLMGPRLQASNAAPTQVNRHASPAGGAPRFDVCVRGDGVVGMALALALARQGLQVAWQGADAAAVPAGAHANASAKTAGQSPDLRAFALNAESVALLTELKVWDALPQAARTAVHDMHILGDGAGASLDFSAWSQGLRELAWIVDATDLEQTLRDALRFAPHITRVDNAPSGQVDGLPGGHSGGLTSGLTSGPKSGPKSGSVNATLLAVAEGKGSASRQALGASVDVQRYGHSAVAARLSSDQLHGGLARQWFAAPEVLALLPLDRPEPGASYALVWSVPHARAQALMALEPAAFEQALAQATGGAAGVLRLQTGSQGDLRNGSDGHPHGHPQVHPQGNPPADHRVGRALWPLERSIASPWCGPGWVLLGDAAHSVHPLAGQGLNLGLADVQALAEVIAQRESFRSLGDEKLLRRYARARHWPTRAMLELTDGLWHLFANTNPAARELRNRGMTLLNTLPPLKRWLTARALRS